jgi:hypothetical protein
MTSESDGPVRDGGIVPPSSDGDVGKGSAAWQRLKAGAHQTWSDWRLVGAALLVGRQEAMRIACSNSTNGGRYGAAFGYWLRKNGFADLDKRTRADLLRIMGLGTSRELAGRFEGGSSAPVQPSHGNLAEMVGQQSRPNAPAVIKYRTIRRGGSAPSGRERPAEGTTRPGTREGP